MLFQIKADATFEAKDLENAFLDLSRHFRQLAEVRHAAGGLVSRGFCQIVERPEGLDGPGVKVFFETPKERHIAGGYSSAPT